MGDKKPWVLLFVLILLIPMILSAKEKQKYKEWMEKEVNFIITKAEKSEFKKLKTDKEREFFIELFWAKRDPTPQTEKNEFKEEYYNRLEYVGKSFRYGYKTGDKTDMGKAYLRFGKPARVFRQDPRYEVWVYPSQSWMNLPKESFTVVFTAVDVNWAVQEQSRDKEPHYSLDKAGFVFDRSKTDSRVMEVFYAYPEKVLLYPDLKKLPETKKASSLSSESFEQALIQKVISAGEDIIQIPFDKKVLFTKAEKDSCYLTCLLKINFKEKKESIPEKIILFGRVESETYSQDFSQEENLIKENDYFIAKIGFPVKPGEYNLFLGFYTTDNKEYSIKRDHIEAPNFWGQELSLSSLLVSPQVQEVKSPSKKGKFDVFSLGRYSLLPHFSQEYTKDRFLNVFYYIYNVATDENQNCSLLIEFELQKGERKIKLNPQNKKKPVGEGATILEGTQFPISAFQESGEYELSVKVTDEIAKKSAIQKIKFIVL